MSYTERKEVQRIAARLTLAVAKAQAAPERERVTFRSLERARVARECAAVYGKRS